MYLSRVTRYRCKPAVALEKRRVGRQLDLPAKRYKVSDPLREEFVASRPVSRIDIAAFNGLSNRLPKPTPAETQKMYRSAHIVRIRTASITYLLTRMVALGNRPTGPAEIFRDKAGRGQAPPALQLQIERLARDHCVDPGKDRSDQISATRKD